MKVKIITGIIIIAILALAFWWGGNAPDTEDIALSTATDAPTEESATEAVSEPVTDEPGDAEYSEGEGMEIDPETGKDDYDTDPVPQGKPVPVEPEEAVVTETRLTCTISVNCSTVLSNMEYLEQGKEAIIPADGVILPPTEVVFYEGENIFQVLRRTLKAEGIHLEFQNTPIYNTAYIEGIGNLYEFDCGELSGWVYRVNGWFPGYGCSRYVLSDGERVEFLYTCNLGEDVGGNNIAK